MAALHHAVVGGKRQVRVKAGVALGLILVELLAHEVDVRDLEVVGRELALVLEEDVAIGHGSAIRQVAPRDVIDRVHALSVHGDALEAIGDLDRHGVDLDAADLLEVGELGDLHAIHPHLPAKAPGAKRRALPVVLDEAHVVLGRVQANGCERPKVEVLGVDRGRLEEHLELVVVLQAVGVLAIATVSRTAARLRIAGAPGGGAKRAQERGSVEGARTNLGVVRLHDGAALVSPVVLKGEDHVLERKRAFAHIRPSSRRVFRRRR